MDSHNIHTAARLNDTQTAPKNEAPKKGFISFLFTSMAFGVGAYVLMKTGAPSPDPLTAASVAVASASTASMGVGLAKSEPTFADFGFILGAAAGVVVNAAAWGAGAVIAGSAGTLAALALAAPLSGHFAYSMIGTYYQDDISSKKVVAGVVTGAALSALLAFSTAAIPGFSFTHNKPAVDTNITAPAAPAP